jgi:hypothetical protein
MQFGENDPLGRANLSGFVQGLSEMGWTDGRNMRMDVRWEGAPVRSNLEIETSITSLGREPGGGLESRHGGGCNVTAGTST